MYLYQVKSCLVHTVEPRLKQWQYLNLIMSTLLIQVLESNLIYNKSILGQADQIHLITNNVMLGRQISSNFPNRKMT